MYLLRDAKVNVIVAIVNIPFTYIHTEQLLQMDMLQLLLFF